MSEYRLRLLGRPILTVNGDSVALQPKAIVLLAYLARQPLATTSRELLSALLWPDESVENARHNLRQLLWSLRQSAGALLSVSREEVSLVEGLNVDIRTFLEYLDTEPTSTAGRPSALDALRLYGGQFLDGFEPGGGADLEDWLLGEREYLHRLFSRRVLQLAASEPVSGTDDAAIEFLERLLRFDPLDETVALKLMTRYEEAGEPRLALRVYRALASAIERELNAEPSPNLREIAQGLSAIDPRRSLEEEEASPTGAGRNDNNVADSGILPVLAVVYVLFPVEESGSSLEIHERAKVLGECHYWAQRIASRFGAQASERRGEGHLFLFTTSAAAIEFGLKLWEAWQELQRIAQAPMAGVRMGAHFGEATPLSLGRTWIGRGVQTAVRVAASSPWQGLAVTESILDLLPQSMYEHLAETRIALPGDHLAKRSLYHLGPSIPSHMPLSSDQRAQALFLKAVSYFGTSLENSNEEEAVYREILAMEPRHAEAHNNLAVILRRRGDDHNAAVHYRQALVLRPGYAEAHYNYALLLESTGNSNAAMDHYRTALRIRPDYVDAQLRYAVTLLSHGQIDEARRRYERVLQLRPGYAEAHNNYAILLEDLGERQAARAHYQTAIEIRSDYVEAHYNLALHYEMEGNDAEAEAHYKQALAIRPAFAEARSNYAALLYREDRVQESLVHYRVAVEERPNDPEANYNYALALAAIGENLSAEEYFRIAREFANSVAPFISAVER